MAKPAELSESELHQIIEEYTRGKNWEHFLDENMHLLTHRIDVEEFFCYLRSKTIMDGRDQEIIEGKYLLQQPRAMALIDLVKRRGSLAFYHFMEVLQYLYVNTFTAMTQMEAKPTPPEFQKRDPSPGKRKTAVAAEIMHKMTDYISHLSHQLSSKRDEIESLMSKMKEEEGRLNSAYESVYQDLLTQKKKCDELEENNQRLEQEKTVLEKEKQDAIKKRDEYLQRFNTARNKSLRKTNFPVDQGSRRNRTNGRDAEIRAPADKANDEAGDSDDDAKALEETEIMHQSQLGEAQKERDQVQKKYDVLEQENAEIKEDNFHLKNMLESLNNEMMNLDKELLLLKGVEDLPPMRPRLLHLPLRGPKPIPSPVIPIDSVDDEEDSLYDKIDLPSEDDMICSEESEEEYAANIGSGGGIQTPDERCTIRLKPHRTQEPKGEGGRRRPVVLLAPESIRDALVQELLEKWGFFSCKKTVVDQCRDDWLTETVFHYERCGSNYICLERAHLDQAMKSYRVLLSVPADVVRKLHQWNISCIVIQIKVACGGRGDRQMTAEDETLADMPKAVKNLTETVTVSAAEAGRLDLLARAVKTALHAVEERNECSSPKLNGHDPFRHSNEGGSS